MWENSVFRLCIRCWSSATGSICQCGRRLSPGEGEQFENLVQMWDCGEMLKRVKKVNLPYHTSEKKGNAYVEELVGVRWEIM